MSAKWTDPQTVPMVVYMAQTAAWPADRFRVALDRILDETGLNQTEIAALVPMDPSQLSRWRSGSTRPKFDSLVALGDALRSRYPRLNIGPNQLLEAAGYAPPDVSVAQVSQVRVTSPAGPNSVTLAGGGGPDITVDLTADPDADLLTALGVDRLDELPFDERIIAMMDHYTVGARIRAIKGLRRDPGSAPSPRPRSHAEPDTPPRRQRRGA